MLEIIVGAVVLVSGIVSALFIGKERSARKAAEKEAEEIRKIVREKERARREVEGEDDESLVDRLSR